MIFFSELAKDLSAMCWVPSAMLAPVRETVRPVGASTKGHLILVEQLPDK